MQSDESVCLLKDQQYGECIEIQKCRDQGPFLDFSDLPIALCILSVLNTVAGRHKPSKLHLFV